MPSLTGRTIAPTNSFWWIVGDGVGFAVTQIEAGGFVASEWARAATAEDGDLITAFVDGTIAVSIPLTEHRSPGPICNVAPTGTA